MARCPSELWESYVEMCEQAEQADEWAAETEAIESLDAYGHLEYCVGWSDECTDDVPEDSDRGDWLACCDFAVFTDEEGQVKVAYHVVVNSDSGGFIDTLEQSVVDADKAPFDLPDYWRGIGFEHNSNWTPAEEEDARLANERWNRDLKNALAQISIDAENI